MILTRCNPLALPLIAMLGACSSTEQLSGLQTQSAGPVAAVPERGTPVVPGRAARVFVMASFGPNCEPVTAPTITVDKPPAKGVVTLQPGQTTTVQYSLSGKCIGRQVPGTGIYYTANAGESGADSFTVSARMGAGEIATRTFNVKIAD